MFPQMTPQALITVALLLAASCAAPSAPAQPTRAESSFPAAAEGQAPPGGTSDRAANLKAIYVKAKAEGEVIFKTGMEHETAVQLLAAFQGEYPGIRGTYVPMPHPDIPSQIVPEAAAGKVSTDVALGTIGYVLPLAERNLLVQYDWGQLFQVTDGTLEFDGRLVTLYENPGVVIYNTDLLTPNEAPRVWDDLLDRRFGGGKMALSGITGLFWERSEEAAVAFLQKLKAAGIVQIPKRAAGREMLMAGQILIASSDAAGYMLDRAKGAPVGLTSVGPQVVISTSTYTVRGSPHPNAALLLIAWLQSSTAREMLTKSNRGKAAPCSAGPMAQVLCEAKVKLVSLDTVEKVRKDVAYRDKEDEALGYKAR